jgi:hypothetical protein
MSNKYKDRSKSTYVLDDSEPLYVTWESIRIAALTVTKGDELKARQLVLDCTTFSDDKINKIFQNTPKVFEKLADTVNE